jgi:Tol biopolymer transport system component/DNA-binding winged helix-turn-helix (wHTH) protein
MSLNQARHAVIPFGPFEADLQTQELRKHGARLRLPGQSFQILKMLLERPGELVTREELQRALWPSDTYVDFDHGVNAAVNRLREALGDSAEKPCFIETLPRRGYRFIIPIAPSCQAASGESAGATQRIESAGGLNWFKVGAWILVAAGCAIAMIFAYLRFRPRPEPQAWTEVPFTAYPGKEDMPTFSPDGSQIAFAWDGDPPPGSKGYDLYVKVIGNENLLRLTRDPSEYISLAWSPDGTQIAFHRISGAKTGVYVIPALGGTERKLRSTSTPWEVGTLISWCPDGKWIAYSEFAEGHSWIHLLSVETLESKEIAHASECLGEGEPAFSHSGKQLAYICGLKDAVGIYSIATSGGSPRLVTTINGTGQLWGGLVWTGDDRRLILSRPRGGMDYALDEITVADGSIRKLPFGQNAVWPAISAKGDRLAYTTYSFQSNIWRKDLLRPQSPAIKLISSTRWQGSPQYSPDGNHIAFESDRGGAGEIWMSDADGTHLVQISNLKDPQTGNPAGAGVPAWSPDSQRIAFASGQFGHRDVYIVDIAERMPRKVVTNLTDMWMPSWSHDGRWIYFQSATNDTAVGTIFRCPASGGNAVSLSRERLSFSPVESYDGETVYFSNGAWTNAPLYMASLKPGGTELAVAGMPAMFSPCHYTVAPGGIYFVPADMPHSIRYFEFNSNKVRQLFEADKDLDCGLSVSADGRWILYAQLDESNRDIMLVDHFH